MTPDANQIGQEQRRRAAFAKWLLKAWNWAEDTNRTDLAYRIEELLKHCEEEDYPVWDKAAQIGLTSEGKVANILRNKFGIPVLGPKMIGWEREINFSPVIAIDERIWEVIYQAMGWANRTSDINWPADNFYLWSNAGNVVRFIKKVRLNEDQS